MNKAGILISLFAIHFISSCQKQPISNFSTIGNTHKVGKPVFFSNNSENANSYFWNFGDGMTSVEENPQHTYNSSGNFTASLDVQSKNKKKSHSSSKNFFVNPALDFTYSASIVNVGEVVSFTAITNAFSVIWDFGNGNFSSLKNSTNIYYNPGVYNITLNAEGETKTKSIEVLGYDFTGNFNVVDSCNSGIYNYNCNITPNGNIGYYISNISGTGEDIFMSVNGINVILPTQVVAGLSFSGNGQINDSNNITLTYYVSSGSNTDTCRSKFFR